jgi:hypothetical protein
MTRWMICNRAESRSGWLANRMRELDGKREYPLAHRHARSRRPARPAAWRCARLLRLRLYAVHRIFSERFTD